MYFRKQISIPVLFFVFVLFGFVSLTTKNIHIDELESHIPTVRYFMENSAIDAITGEGYKSASTPLPYILLASVFNLMDISADITSVRTANIIISFLTMLILLFILRNEPFSFPSMLIIFFYPYFLKPTFTFHMAMYGLIFFLLFLIYSRKDSFYSTFAAGLCLSLAVSAQQFYLIIVPFYFFLLGKRFIDLKSDRKTTGIQILSFSLPFLLLIPIFLLWGGLTHPSYSSWGISFYPEYTTSVLIVLGGTLAPFLFFHLKVLNTKILIIITSLAVILVIFAYPVWVSQPMIGGISGYSFRTIDIIANYSSVIGFLIKLLLTVLGLYSFVFIYKKRKQINIVLLISFIAFIIGFMINKLPSERHMLPLVITSYLIVFSLLKNKSVYNIWVPLQIILGSIYFYYIMFIYSIP